MISSPTPKTKKQRNTFKLLYLGLLQRPRFLHKSLKLGQGKVTCEKWRWIWCKEAAGQDTPIPEMFEVLLPIKCRY